MPDIYFTEIVAFGTTADVTALHQYLSPENGGFSFNRFIPMPLNEKYEDLNDWRCANWGTKWDCDHTQITLFSNGPNGHVSISYSCPWGASIPVSIKLSQLLPNLTFLIKEQIDPYFGGVEISAFSSSTTLETVLVERNSAIITDDGLDVASTYTTDEGFMGRWADDVSIQKAMLLLGYGEEERLLITQIHEQVHTGNLPFETA